MKIQIKRPVALHEAGGKSLNEDFIWPTKDKASVDEELFIVCDGEGGPNAGENASKLIGLSFAKFYASTPPVENTQKEYLEAALMKAEAALSAYKNDHEDKKQMRATLSLLHFGKSEVTLAWIGDSQAYFYSHGKGELLGSNQEALDAEQFIEGTDKPAKIQCINIPYEDIGEHDYLFLGSKGISEQVGSTTLAAMFSAKNKPSPDFIIDEINSLSEGFTKDNYSCYLIQIEKVAKEMTAVEAGKEALANGLGSSEALEPMTSVYTENETDKKDTLFRNIAIGALVLILGWVFLTVWYATQEDKYVNYMAEANQLIEQNRYHNAIDQIDSALNHIRREVANNNMTEEEAAELINEAQQRKKEILQQLANNSGVVRKINPADLDQTAEEYIQWGNESMRLGNYQLALEGYEKALMVRGDEAEPAIPIDSQVVAYLNLGNQLFDAQDKDCDKVLAFFDKAFSHSDSKVLSADNVLYTQSVRRSESCNTELGRFPKNSSNIAQKSRGLNVDAKGSTSKQIAEAQKPANNSVTKSTQQKTTSSQNTSRGTTPTTNPTRRVANSGINSVSLNPETESRLRKALSDGKRFYIQAKEQDSKYLYKQSAIQLEEASGVLDGSGAYLLAYLYHIGQGVDADNAKALKYAQKSALKNWPAGHYLYAHLLLQRNNPRDTITAIQSLNKAAELNYLDALKRLEELRR